MAFKLDTIEIRERSKPDTVETKLTTLKLWDVVSPLLDDSRFPVELRGRILQVPVKENKSVRLAGKWVPSEKVIYLNQLLIVEHETATFLHELAHCVADLKYGFWIAAHGWQWAQVMITFGQKPERCHNYNLRNYGGQ